MEIFLFYLSGFPYSYILVRALLGISDILSQMSFKHLLMKSYLCFPLFYD